MSVAVGSVRRFFLYGYFGYQNFGDDLLVAAAVDGIERHVGPSEFYVRNFGDVPTLQARPNVHLTDCDAILVDGRRSKAIRAAAYLLRYWSLFRSCDAFVMAGGTYFHDRTTKSVALLAAACLMARIQRLRVFAIGVGIADLHSRRARFLLKTITRMCDMFAVRDQRSFDQVKGNRDRVALTADLAFNLPVRKPKRAHDSRVIAIALAGPAIEEEPALKATLIPAINETIDRLLASGWYVQLLEMQRFEVGLGSKRIGDGDLLHNLCLGRSDSIRVVTMPRTEGEVADLYGSFGIVVGMRFHSIVLAALYEVPFVGIAHDTKIVTLCTSYSMPFIPAHTLRATEVESAIKNVVGRRPSREVTEKMAQASARNFEAIANSFSEINQ
jgi:polysaccharide pyruvyl transferase WcaK-like protein